MQENFEGRMILRQKVVNLCWYIVVLNQSIPYTVNSLLKKEQYTNRNHLWHMCYVITIIQQQTVLK